jgi:VWFA-related protein
MPLARFAGAFVLVFALEPALARQAPTPQLPGFRSGTDLVQVDVSVLDGRRQPVMGLTAEDFTVLENGTPRPVAAFAAVNLPAPVTSGDAAWTREVAPDVTTNQIAANGGRVVVILFDRSIPVGPATMTAKKIAAAAVNALGPGDMAALVSTSGVVPQNLTADRTRLLAAINRPRDLATDISDEAKEIEADVGLSSGVFNKLADGRCLCGLCVLETITNVANALEGMARLRKSVLFIGSDITFQAGPQVDVVTGDSRGEFGCGEKLREARGVMERALDRSGVIVHSIDPSGLKAVGPMGLASSTLKGVFVRPAYDGAVAERLQQQGSLQVLPARTGGRVVMNTNAPEERVPAILQESASYYVPGYRPAEPQVPGQARKIDVTVRRRGVTVSARREYVVPVVAAVTETKDEVGAAMRSGMPVADSPLAITASSFGARGRSTAAVAVAIDVSGIAAQAVRPGGTRAALEIAVAAYDMRGQPEGTVEAISVSDVPVRPDRRLEAVARLDLPPGDHELRAAVVAEGTGRTASVFTHINVPPFARNPLTLSHIVMAANARTDTIQRQRLSDLLPIAPTTNREFLRTDAVTAFMQVYQGLDRTDVIQPVAITATVADRTGKTRVQEALTLKATAFADVRTADCKFTLPVSRLEAGEYLLTVVASIGAREAGRAIRFSVQ